jgi:alkylation response protein AidB-like acyl-CoA dehydrogenase
MGARSSEKKKIATLQSAVGAAREFAMQVMRPAGIELDRMADPAGVIAPGSVLWDVHRAFRREGFHKAMIFKAYGGWMEDMPHAAWPLMNEQLGYGDAGLGISLAVSCMPFAMCVLSAEPEVRKLARQFSEDTGAGMIGCWGITEPDHGSDWVLGCTAEGANPRVSPSLRAVKKGNEYILNGMKSAWVSNGTIATHAVLHVGLDPSRGMHGQGIAFCPLDLPGISRGKPLDKIGQRPLNQGELVFDEVRLPAKYLLSPKPGIMAIGMVARRFLGIANHETGMLFAGLARAAFEEALEYAKQNSRGGRLLFDQQQVRLKLFRMFGRVEAASALAHKVSDLMLPPPPTGMVKRVRESRGTMAVTGKALQMFLENYDSLNNRRWFRKAMERASRSEQGRRGIWGIAHKIVATETAFEVASQAMQIFGHDALDRRYPIEKMFRDARASMIEDGVNEALALAASVDL